MPFDHELYKRALDFAARAHGDQRVPGSGYPYVVHVAKVAMEVIAATETEGGLDRDLAITCALLHDTVEDAEPRVDPETGADRARTDWLFIIRTEFGDSVAAGVSALTKDARLPKSERMADSLRRLQQQPRAVQIVKLADRITNLEPAPSSWSREKRSAYFEEAKEILAALGGASACLAARLRRKLFEYPGVSVERRCSLWRGVTVEDGEQWDELEERLTRLLGCCRYGETLVLGSSGTNGCVRVTVDGQQLHAQAVATDGPNADLEMLLDLGWAPAREHMNGNEQALLLTRSFREPRAPEAAACVILATLAGPFRVSRVSDLRYDASDEEGKPIQLPVLGLARSGEARPGPHERL